MKIHRRNNLVTVIRRSCLTGKVVWIYRGQSHDGARQAYWRACRKEVRRVRMWMQKVNERRRNLSQFVSRVTGSMPPAAELTQEQREAARQLRLIEKREYPCHREFYDHIMEETRRKNEASGRWREQRNRWLGRKPWK